ncbi:hypothetical protein [Streptomyces sp. Je 1-332]|uniref:hypothetical protein n=1 Tax=Streptomyces sp. Je 1-332 TaxID=3231270 RepID=UPI0034587919
MTIEKTVARATAVALLATGGFTLATSTATAADESEWHVMPMQNGQGTPSSGYAPMSEDAGSSGGTVVSPMGDGHGAPDAGLRPKGDTDGSPGGGVAPNGFQVSQNDGAPGGGLAPMGDEHGAPGGTVVSPKGDSDGGPTGGLALMGDVGERSPGRASEHHPQAGERLPD